jgi:hypothetical protein
MVNRRLTLTRLASVAGSQGPDEMSELGQSRRFHDVRAESVRPSTTDIFRMRRAATLVRAAGFEPAQPLNSAEFRSGSRPSNVVFVKPAKTCKDMPGLHWAANEISLGFVAFDLAQEIELFGAFDTFCDNADLQVQSQSD